MKAWLTLVLCASCVSPALAEPPAAPDRAAQQAASKLVDEVLVTPLPRPERRRSRFSREGPVASQRRVCVLDAELLTDTRGKRFVRFAIDVRRPDEDEKWRRDAILGCAYPDDDQVFVRQDEEYLPAASLLGKDTEPEPGACRSNRRDEAS